MHVLIVDDHTLFRDGVALLLQRALDGVVVSAVASCADAFRVLRETKAVDLVLMDLGLPDVSGAEGLRMLREHYPDLPVVVLSAANDSATVRRAIKDGAMGFIPKSHSADLLVGALQFILVHRGVYLPPDILLDAAEQPSAPALPSDGRAVSAADLGLTPRQGDVLRQLLEGKSNKAIARALGIEESTVKVHVNAVLRALKVTTRTAAVIAAGRMKLTFDDTVAGQ